MTFIQQFVSSLSLCVSVAPFWRAFDGHKVRTLFSVISNAWIRCFRSNQSVNKCTILIHALPIFLLHTHRLHK